MMMNDWEVNIFRPLRILMISWTFATLEKLNPAFHSGSVCIRLCVLLKIIYPCLFKTNKSALRICFTFQHNVTLNLYVLIIIEILN